MKISVLIVLGSAAFFNSASAAVLNVRSWSGQPACGLVEGGDPSSTSPRREGVPYLRSKGNSMYVTAPMDAM
ncbi:hypothetical protein Dda_5019 [Drechslerella dactyloides]|uniref:Uncharacterized protein n=1 Tax=Drechslerella dactyloides TaxID=74499 RepID=A0AAD6J096_DREDA|nr:hypothetical protein Dda_5019 [Drechslerella dactyloides]